MKKKYEFKLDPYEHQKAALRALWNKEYGAELMDMGTGKSKVLIDNVGILYEQGDIWALLLIAPKGVYRNWSEIEIPKHLPDRIPVRTAYWKSAPNKKEQQALDDIVTVPFNGLNVLVMNIDAITVTKRSSKGFDMAEKFLSFYSERDINGRITEKRALMAIDESTCIKNISAKRTKAAINLGKMARCRRILTGLPVTKWPLDLYAQCAFLGEGLLGHKSYFTFKMEFAIERVIRTIVKTVTVRGRPVQKKIQQKAVVGFKNIDKLQKRLESFSYRIMKEDCLDLPAKVYMTRNIELTKEQKKIYKDMREDCLADCDGQIVSATNIIVKILRLHQIACGHVTYDTGVSEDLPNHRISELLNVLDETNGKVIIWAAYRRDIQKIAFEIKNATNQDGELKYGEDSVVSFYGDTRDEDRVAAVNEFQDPNSPVRFFVGNPSTGGFGLTLTEAKTVIYFSNTYNLEHRLQSEDRAHRVGQDSNVTYIDFVCPDTVDEKILKALKQKKDLAHEVVGDDPKDWL